MGVSKYTGKKGIVYFIDYYVNGKRFREQVGAKKKEAEECLGKRLKEIRDGKFRETPVRQGFFDELADLYEKQGKGRRATTTRGITSRPSGALRGTAHF